MIDIHYVAANRHGKVFHMLSIPGKSVVGHDWEFMREGQTLNSRAKYYIFARQDRKTHSRIEVQLTRSQLERVYEVTAYIPEPYRIDLAQLESFCYQ